MYNFKIKSIHVYLYNFLNMLRLLPMLQRRMTQTYI